MDRMIDIIDGALMDMPDGTLSKGSSLKPKSFTTGLMDTLSEFLADALRAAKVEGLQRKIAATVTKFANIRGDFRYKVLRNSIIPLGGLSPITGSGTAT